MRRNFRNFTNNKKLNHYQGDIMAFGQKNAAKEAAKTAPQTNAGPPADHYADVTEMVNSEGKKSKFVKFVQDVSDPATGLNIPKGTIFTFDTYTDIYERVANPSQKMLDWLTSRTEPFTTTKGAVLTGFGIIKKPFNPKA